MYDVVIIGAGVVGAMVARKLAAYQLKTCILEKENDVAMGASKANSAIIHAGFDAKEGTIPKATFERKEELNTDDSKKVRVNLSSLVGMTGAPKEVQEKKPVEKKALPKQDLYLKVPSENSREMGMVQSVLEIFNYGNMDVYIYFEDTKKLVRALDTHSFVTDTMMETLGRILGDGNVKLKEKK